MNDNRLILESLYRDTFSAVRIGADLSEWFETIGVLQGCILSPILFNVFLALGDNNVGAAMNGNVISNLGFADDIAATTESE